MFGELLREDIEDLAVEVARGAVMLEDLNDALRDLGVVDHFSLEGGRAELLDESPLVNFLALVEMVDLPVEELVNEGAQIFAYLIEEDDLPILVGVGVGLSQTVAAALKGRSELTLGDGLESLALLGVHDYDIWEDLGEFLGVEQLRGL